jgi:hypothetical protein
MQTLEQVGYYTIPDPAVPAAPTANIPVWLTDPELTDSALIERLKDMNLPLTGRSQLVRMFTRAGRVSAVEFLEKNGAWNPYMHGDQWFARIVEAIDSGKEAMIKYTAQAYSREALAPFCVLVDKRALLVGILARTPLSVAKVAIEVLGLKNVSILPGDAAAIDLNKQGQAYDVNSELGKLVWRHQKSLHLTVGQNSVSAHAYCCDHSCIVDNRTGYKGQYSNICIGLANCKPANGRSAQVTIRNVSGPFVLLGFVNESKNSNVEFYLIPTSVFSPYSRTVLKGRDHPLDAFSILQIGATACYAVATKSAESYRIDWQTHGCVHLMLRDYALVAIHSIKNVEHAMLTAANHGFIDKLKSMVLGDEEPEGDKDKPKDDKGKDEQPKTAARHSSDVLKELRKAYPPSVTIE